MSEPAAPRTSGERTTRRGWHALEVAEACAILGTDPATGLCNDAIDERRQRFGPNRLTPVPERTALMRFLAQFHNLFIYLLLAAGTITALLEQWIDSGVIFGVVVIIAVIGFVQEGRAERALHAVRNLLSSRARVLRGGQRQEIAAEELVPGDVVYLEAGDRVPADVRLAQTRGLRIQEAVLTGESEAVDKRSAPVAEDAELGDRVSVAFSATMVTAGQGAGVVVATGDASEIGRISGLLSRVEALETPLMQRLNAFTRGLSVVVIGAAAVTLAVGVLVWERDWGEMFLAAVSIAVAAIPEGLPAVMTVTLAIGVERMARRNAIIRRLPAVETLGSVTVVCSDKTGTLTRNEMTAKTVCLGVELIEVEGVGYEPLGRLLRDGNEIRAENHPALTEMLRAGMLCGDAGLRRLDDETWEPVGDPTEVALVVLALKAGIDARRASESWPRLDVIPFMSERRYMATLHRGHEETRVVYVKGAPERVLEMCGSAVEDGALVDLDADAWHRRAEEIAARGQRVLAVARKDVAGGTGELVEEEVEQGLTLLGFFGLIDPPRQEAIEAVSACQSAGVRVKMITGDHALTACAVARDLGIENPERVLTGRELERIADEQLRQVVLETDIYARASPEHKLRLVEALQSRRQITAMTGDGVNDAPALKRADIGIAMGQKGTEAAREAAAMVLADDNFASIAKAIDEGRTVYDNLRKALIYILPTNAGEALVIMYAIVFGLALPITPVQILWINMATAITLGMALAWERAEGDVMSRPPRPVAEALLSPLTIWRVCFVGVLLLAGAGAIFVYEQGRPETTVEFARTAAVNALVMGEIFYLLNARFLDRPSLTLAGMTGNGVIWIAISVCIGLQLLFIYAPFMNLLFGSAPIDGAAWLHGIAVGAAVFVLVEIEKAVRRVWRGRAGVSADVVVSVRQR